MAYKILLLIPGIILVITGQILLKKGMARYKTFSMKDLPEITKNGTIILGIAAYGISLLLWLVVLSKLELSYAYPIVSLNYFFIALSSKIIFKEKISKRRWASILVIVLGVITVSLS